jgi:hypothetical protein
VRLMRANRIFVSKHWKLTLQLRWSKCWNHKHISERVISLLQNVPNTYMRLAKQTDRKSDTKKIQKQSNKVSSTMLFSAVPNSVLEFKTEPNELRLRWNFTHLSKYVSKISPNFKLNSTYESHVDLKIQQKLGFCWVF